MSKRTIKSIFFVMVAILVSLIWRELIKDWKNNIYTPHIGNWPTEFEFFDFQKDDVSGFYADVNLSELNIQNSTVTFLVSVNYKGLIDQDRNFPSLRNIVLNIYQPSGEQWIKSTAKIPVEENAGPTSVRQTRQVLSNYPVTLPLYPVGSYPYETYDIEIEPALGIYYPGGGRSNGAVRNLNIPSNFNNSVFQYNVTICGKEKPNEAIKDCQNLPPEIHKIIFKQPNQKRNLLFAICSLFMIFVMLSYWINDLGSLLQVTAGLLLGIWGLREIIVPDKISYSLSWEGENIIMAFYVTLGIIMIFWIINSAVAHFFFVTLNPNNIPNNVYNSLWVRYPHIMNAIFETEEYWDTNTVAAYLGVSPASVREQARNNSLPGEKVNGNWRFSSQEIMAIGDRQRHF